MFFHTTSTLPLLALLSLALRVASLPVSFNTTLTELESRSSDNCEDGKPAPCVCGTTGKAIGLRLKALKCPAKTVAFANPTVATDGSVKVNPSSAGTVINCDHALELQFIANEIKTNPAICTHFQSGAQGTTDFNSFFTLINSPTNLINVDKDINAAKAIVIGGRNFQTTPARDRLGAANYLKLLSANQAGIPGTKFATTVDSKMTSIMGAGKGFKAGFQGRWDALVKSATNKAIAQSKVTPKPKKVKKPKAASTAKKTKSSTSKKVSGKGAIIGTKPVPKKSPLTKPAGVTKAPAKKVVPKPVAKKPLAPAKKTKP